jgi:GT2 family glycosyltransferase
MQSAVSNFIAMDKVSIVIPVYGQWNLAKRNIDALLKYDREFIREILVVDDLSPDSNPYTFDTNFVRVITNERNLGYAGTVNNGLRQANSDVVVLLDSDAYPISPFIKNLLEMYAHDNTIGCIGFGTIDENGIDTGNYQHEPSAAGFILGQHLQAQFGFLRFWRSKNLLPNSCAVSFRKACLEEVGYFDNKLFPVLDADVDISMNIYRSKWKLIFTKKIIICHKGGNSYKINYKRFLLHHDSRWKLLNKHGRIGFPSITKKLLKARVRAEIIVLQLLVKQGKIGYTEKVKGRQMLLDAIDSYKYL